MIPEGGVATILSASQSLFSGLKPIILLLLGVLVAFIILEFIIDLIFKRANDEGEVKNDERRVSERIIGSKTLNEIKEINFLAQKLGRQLPAGWQSKVKTQIYEQRFSELTEKYGVLPEIQLAPKQNFFQRIVKRFKRS